MSARFLRTIKFSDLAGYWKKPKPEKSLSEFVRLTVICCNYGRICQSDGFYEKEDWREFEKFLMKDGWRVMGDNLYCPSCDKRELDREVS